MHPVITVAGNAPAPAVTEEGDFYYNTADQRAGLPGVF